MENCNDETSADNITSELNNVFEDFELENDKCTGDTKNCISLADDLKQWENGKYDFDTIPCTETGGEITIKEKQTCQQIMAEKQNDDLITGEGKGNTFTVLLIFFVIN